MKIVQLETAVKKNKRPDRVATDAIQTLIWPGSVTVEITAEDGSMGVGACSFGRVAGAPDTLAALIENELKPLVVGQDTGHVRGIHEQLIREVEYHGYRGLAMFGISAIDTALWDCIGKSLDVPCWKLWGAAQETIPAYAMVGWLNYEGEQLEQRCQAAVDQGFRAVKIKVGSSSLREDLGRIERVRAAVGDDIRIMVDANQALTVAEAIRRGRAFQESGAYWWEEPIPADDLEGYAELSRALDIPIASGENLFSRHDFARFLARGALDIVQVDLRRGGGPTALLQIGLMADSFRRPYASHGGGPVQLNVMACLPSALYLETGLIAEGSPMKLVDGCVPIPTGSGFSWD